MKMNECFTLKTEKEKKAIWKDYCDKQTEKVGELQKAGAEILARLHCLELMGGPCPLCKRQWERVTFDSIIYSGEYWVPACSCYHSCPRCGKELYLEQESGILRANGDACTNCHWPLTELKRQANIKNQTTEGAKIFLERYYDKILRNPRKRK